MTRFLYLKGCDTSGRFARDVKHMWKTGNSNHTVAFFKWKMCSAAALFHCGKLRILPLEQGRKTATCKAQDVVAAALRLDGHALQHASQATWHDVCAWFHLVPCKLFSNHCTFFFSHVCHVRSTCTDTYIERESDMSRSSYAK